jgi:hypothetical protein
MASLIEARDTGLSFANKELGTNAKVITIEKEGKNWKQIIEIIEEKNVIEDVLGIYEIVLDEDSKIISYNRKGLRKSTDVSGKYWEKTF